MDPTIVLGVIIAILIVIIIMLLISGGKSNDGSTEHQAPGASSEEKFNTTFTPNSAPNQTAPLVKGKQKKQKPILNEEQLATAGKDETFLPQTTSSAQEASPADDDDDALTRSAKRT